MVNYLHGVKWRRISKNHIQFTCTLACRSATQNCVVHLNDTTNSYSATNMSTVTKKNFSTSAKVDFFVTDANQAFTYMAFADNNAKKVLGRPVYGIIPSVSMYIA